MNEKHPDRKISTGVFSNFAPCYGNGFLIRSFWFYLRNECAIKPHDRQKEACRRPREKERVRKSARARGGSGTAPERTRIMDIKRVSRVRAPFQARSETPRILSGMIPRRCLEGEITSSSLSTP